MSPTVINTVRAIAAASMFALAGCGGGSGSGGGGGTCQEACGNLYACASHLGLSGSDVATAFGSSNYDSYSSCLSHCLSGTCPHQQQLLDCAVKVQCNSIAQVASDTAACFNGAGCEP